PDKKFRYRVGGFLRANPSYAAVLPGIPPGMVLTARSVTRRFLAICLQAASPASAVEQCWLAARTLPEKISKRRRQQGLLGTAFVGVL
ncbi:MAG TPA: hypothetical protein VJX28_00955, partial [Chthoniobacterales bacterium]|nr:hypothetical protein [Chthoniobacterales bacterium]